MKKLLSLVLVLLMILGIVACGTTKPAETPAPVATQAPAAEKPAEQPTEAPKEPEAPKATYVALGLNIKNKTGVTIDEVCKQIGATRDEIDLLLMDNVFAKKNITEESKFSTAWKVRPK